MYSGVGRIVLPDPEQLRNRPPGHGAMDSDPVTSPLQTSTRHDAGQSSGQVATQQTLLSPSADCGGPTEAAHPVSTSSIGYSYMASHSFSDRRSRQPGAALVPAGRDPVKGVRARQVTRRFTHRSKTGCITCKQRKKKCDEAKPGCQNCRRNNLECGGYKGKAAQRGCKVTSFVTLLPAESKASNVAGHFCSQSNDSNPAHNHDGASIETSRRADFRQLSPKTNDESSRQLIRSGEPGQSLSASRGWRDRSDSLSQSSNCTPRPPQPERGMTKGLHLTQSVPISNAREIGGEEVSLRQPSRMHIVIGDNVVIGPHYEFRGSGSMTIGRNTRIGAGVTIGFDSKVRESSRSNLDLEMRIGNDVQIDEGCIFEARV